MLDFLAGIDLTAAWAAIIGFITLNVGTIVVQLIANIKLKVKNFKYNETIDTLQAKYEAKALELQELFTDRLTQLQNAIQAKIDYEKQLEADRLASEGDQISNNIIQAKAKLSIDQILED